MVARDGRRVVVNKVKAFVEERWACLGLVDLLAAREVFASAGVRGHATVDGLWAAAARDGQV